MAEAISEPVKKCIAILKGSKTDTEKFAALFMVTKLVKGKDCTTVAKKALFEAIGFQFLKKLLLSADVPEDCPPLVYKSVALSILTCFCQDEELATHKEMLENIPVFLDIVQTSDDDDYDDNLIVVSEAYSCLQSIASYEPGQKALLEVGAISKMSQIYAQQSFQTDEALNLLVTLANKFGSLAWDEDPKNFHALVNRVGLDFETDHTERKFELCSILGSLLFSCRRQTVGRTAEKETWPGSLFKGLGDILGSRIGKNQRDPALKLASAVVDVLGMEWTLRDEDKPKQFFLLLLQLAAIEVRMQMDDKSLKQALANGELIAACFVILELAVAYMATDTLDLEQKEKQTIYSALKGAFAAVISVLTKVSNDKSRDKLPPKEKSFVCAMVRVLASWLATETSAMRTAVYALLPYMLQLANDTFYAARAHRLSQDKNQGEPDADVLRLLLPALCHLAVEDRARDVLLANKQDEVLYECMAFHWSIAHYKKPPVPRADRLKALTQPEAPLDPQLLADMKDSRAALVSLCNIFMNVTVLEAKIVEESQLFGTLLKFIFNSLPELRNSPENLVLQGHLAVLGLLLLKQQHKRVKKNDFSICSFIQASIRFLWDAYNVDESNDPFALVVSLSYKEHWMEIMELWFLGMQTMSAVLALVPWISDFAVESGWAEGIVTTLKKVRLGSLQPEVKSAYEDFLCHLVDANTEVAEVLKKADALKVCRNHRLMDLGKKLFDDYRCILVDFLYMVKPIFSPTRRDLSAVIFLTAYSHLIAEYLHEEHHISRDQALHITQTYLKAFRLCPDNPECDLNTWRCHLWSNSLTGQHQHLTQNVYLKWLQLRYYYLSVDEHVKHMLTNLRKQYLLGLITNGPSSAQWEKVERLNLMSLFDCVLVSGDLPWAKPDQKIFLKACKYLGVEPKRCVMVGDKLETDIQGGIEAELGLTIWLPLDKNASLDHETITPDYTITNILDLPNILPASGPKSASYRSRSLGNQLGDKTTMSYLQNRRVLSLPEIDDCNSNSSDGS